MKKTILLFIVIFTIANFAKAQNRIELNTELMKSTFKIKGFDGSIGTAFILGKPIKSLPTKGKYVLITANHVLNDMKGDSAFIILRRKNDDNTYTKIDKKIKIREKGRQIWVSHDSADVAALYIELPNYIDINLLGVDILGMDDIFQKIDIHPGDEFMCLGYPLGQESNQYGFPVVRRGVMASYPIIPSKDIKCYLLDIKIFKGNSGGPVYFIHSGRTYKGTLHVETTQFIAGLVSKEWLNITQINSPYKTSVEAQQLDLAVIVPAIFIKETIEKLP